MWRRAVALLYALQGALGLSCYQADRDCTSCAVDSAWNELNLTRCEALCECDCFMYDSGYVCRDRNDQMKISTMLNASLVNGSVVKIHGVLTNETTVVEFNSLSRGHLTFVFDSLALVVFNSSLQNEAMGLTLDSSMDTLNVTWISTGDALRLNINGVDVWTVDCVDLYVYNVLSIDKDYKIIVEDAYANMPNSTSIIPYIATAKLCSARCADNADCRAWHYFDSVCAIAANKSFPANVIFPSPTVTSVTGGAFKLLLNPPSYTDFTSTSVLLEYQLYQKLDNKSWSLLQSYSPFTTHITIARDAWNSRLHSETQYSFELIAVATSCGNPLINNSFSAAFNLTTAQANQPEQKPRLRVVNISADCVEFRCLLPIDLNGSTPLGVIVKVQSLFSTQLYSQQFALDKLSTQWTGLQAATVYTMQSALLTNFGITEWSDSAVFKTLPPTHPSAVNNLTLVNSPNSTIGISWSPPTTSGGVDILCYAIYTEAIGDSGAVNQSVSINTNLTAFGLTWLRSDTQYRVTVEVVNNAYLGANTSIVILTPTDLAFTMENLTTSDFTIMPSTLPSVANLSCTSNYGGVVQLAWDSSHADFAFFQVWYESREHLILAAVEHTMSSTIYGLFAGSLQTFYVNGIDKHGNSGELAHVAVIIGPASKPLPPKQPIVASISGGSINLRIQPLSLAEMQGSRITKYQVMYAPTRKTEMEIGCVLDLTFDCLLTNLTAMSLYDIQVVAFSSEGWSEPSPLLTVSTTMVSLPSPPLDVDLVPSHNKLALAWSPSQDTGGVSLLGYAVCALDDAPNAYYLRDSLPKSNGLVLNVSGLYTNSTRSYSISPINSASIYISSSYPIYSINTFTTEYAPSVVEYIQATPLSGSSINLIWLSPKLLGGHPLTTYHVYRLENNVATEIYKGLEQFFTDFGLHAATTYAYSIVAVNQIGSSNRSEPLFAETLVPSAPSGITYLGQEFTTGGSIQLVWMPPNDHGGVPIINYMVFRDEIFIGNTTTCRYLDTMFLEANTTYHYDILAFNGYKTSFTKVSIDAKTLQPTPPAPLRIVSVHSSGSEVEITWDQPDDTGGIGLSNITAILFYNDSSVLSRATIDPIITFTWRFHFLNASTCYPLLLYSSNVIGNSSMVYQYACTSKATTPTAPPQVIVQNATPSSFLLTTLPPIDNGGSQVTSLTIYVNQTISQTLTSFNVVRISGLLCEQLYALQLSATNGAGESIWSEPTFAYTTPMTPPSEPLDVSVHAKSTRATIFWSPPFEDGGVVQLLYFVDVNGTTLTTESNKIELLDLVPNSFYDFTIQAYNDAGFGIASESTFSTLELCYNDSTVFFPSTSIKAYQSNSTTTTVFIPVARDYDDNEAKVGFYVVRAEDNATLERNTIIFDSGVDTLQIPLQLPNNRSCEPVGLEFIIILYLVDSTSTQLGLNSSASIWLLDKVDGGVVEFAVTSLTIPTLNLTSPTTSVAIPVERWGWIANSLLATITSPNFTDVELFLPPNESYIEVEVALLNRFQYELPPQNLTIHLVVAENTCACVGSQSTMDIILLKENVISLPNPPQNLRHVSSTGSTLTFEWNAPDNSGGKNTHLAYNIDLLDKSGEHLANATTEQLVWTFVGLKSFMEYKVVVSSVNQVGTSLSTNISLATTQPSEPAPVESLGCGFTMDHQLNISWSPPIDFGGVSLRGYQIDVAALNMSQFTTNTSFTWLQNSTSESNLTISVRTTNAYNLKSPPSIIVCTLPSKSYPNSPPQPILLGATGGSLKLRLTRPLDTGGLPILEFTVTISYQNQNQIIQTLTTVSNEINIYDLRPLTLYQVSYTATNENGESPSSTSLIAATTKVTPPTPPTNVHQLLPWLSGAIHLSWSPPLDSGGNPTITYSVQLQNPFLLYTWSEVYFGSETIALITGLRPSTNYTVAVVAESLCDKSLESNHVIMTTSPAVLPSPPAALCITQVTGGLLTLNWSAPNDYNGLSVLYYTVAIGLNSYQVTRTTFTLSGLQPNSTIEFDVVAWNELGPSLPSKIFGTTSSTYTAPSVQVLDVLSTTGGTIELSWTFPVDTGGVSDIEFVLTRNGTMIYQGNSTTFFDSKDILASTLYVYSLQTNSKFVAGEWSQQEFIWTKSASLPSEPIFTWTNATSSSITASWAPPLDTGGVPIAYFLFEISLCQGESIYQEHIENGVYIWRANSLFANHCYDLSLRAVNSIGKSVPAIVMIFTIAPSAPSTPPPPNFITSTSSSITLELFAPVDYGGVPIIQLNIYGNMTLLSVISFNATNTTWVYSITSLAPSLCYEWQISAQNVFGSSALSHGVVGCTSDLDLVVNLRATEITAESATLVWEAPNQLNYSLEYLVQGQMGTLSLTNATFYELVNLSPGTLYQYSVKALNSDSIELISFSTLNNTLGYISFNPSTIIVSPLGNMITVPIVRFGGINGVIICNLTLASLFNASLSNQSVQFDDGMSKGLIPIALSSPIFKQVLTLSVVESKQCHGNTEVYVDGQAIVQFANSSITRVLNENITEIQLPIYKAVEMGTTLHINISISDSFEAIILKSASLTFVRGQQENFVLLQILQPRAFSSFLVTLSALYNGVEQSTVNLTLVDLSNISVPSNVENLNFVQVTSNSLSVEWTAPVDTGGYGLTILSYTITLQERQFTTPGTQTQTTLWGLAADTIYNFTIAATNVAGVGAISLRTFKTQPARAPAPPRILSLVSSTGGSLGVVISPAQDTGGLAQMSLVLQAEGSNHEISESQCDSSVESMVPCVVYVPSASTTYVLRAQARNEIGASNWSEAFNASTTIPTPPSTPVALQTTKRTGGSITLSWLPPMDSGGCFSLFYSIYLFNDTTNQLMRLTTQSETSYVLANLRAMTTYRVGVLAQCDRTLVSDILPCSQDSTCSSQISLVSATTLPPTAPGIPPPPMQLFTPFGGVLSLSVLSPNDTGGVPIIGFEIELNGTRLSMDRVNIIATRVDLLQLTQTIEIGGLAPNAVYNVTIMAKNAALLCPHSLSEASNFIIVNTGPATVPGPNAQLNLVSSTGTTLEVKVLPPFAAGGLLSELNFTIMYKELLEEWKTLDVPFTNSSSVLIKHLTAQTSYAFKVASYNMWGTSKFSDIVEFTTALKSPPGPCGVPKIFKQSTGGSLYITWTPPMTYLANANISYEVYIMADDRIKAISSNNTEVVCSNLLANTIYQVKVRAYNEIGAGAWSEIALHSTRNFTGPTYPTQLGLLSASGGAFIISFTPPADTGGVPISNISYNLYVNGNPLPPLYTLVIDVEGMLVVGHLQCNMNYNIGLQATTAFGSSEISPLMFASTLYPSIPSTLYREDYALQAINATGGMIKLGWNPPLDDGGLSPLTYSIDLRRYAKGDIVQTCSSADEFECPLYHLSPYTTYYATLTVVNALGSSFASPDIMVSTTGFTPPTAPEKIVYQRSGEDIIVSWQPPLDWGGASEIVSYTISLTTALKSSTITTSTRQLRLLNVSHDTTFRITAATQWFTKGMSTTLLINAQAVPLRASCVSAGAITLSWDPFGDQDSVYAVWKDSTSLVYNGSTPFFSDFGLLPNSTAMYSLLSTGRRGQPWSKAINISTLATPGLIQCSGSNGYLSSAGLYTPNSRNVWSIASQSNATIILKFLTFDVECDNDKVIVEEVSNNGTASLLWSGGCPRRSFSLQTNQAGNSVRITLQADDAIELGGITLQYKLLLNCNTKVSKVIPCPTDCGVAGVCNRGKCLCRPGFVGESCSNHDTIMDTRLSSLNTRKLIYVDSRFGNDSSGTGGIALNKAFRSIRRALQEVSNVVTTIVLSSFHYSGVENCNLTISDGTVRLFGLPRMKSNGPIVLDCSGVYNASWSILNSTVAVDGVTLVGEKGNQALISVSRSNLSLSRVLILNGNSNGCGGGLAAFNSTVELDQVVISNNTALKGGGICLIKSQLFSTSSMLYNNSAAEGGGGAFTDGSSIEGLSIVKNFGGVCGGGVIHNSTTSSLTNVFISQNNASTGGGISMLSNTSIIMKNVLIENNFAVLGGGLSIVSLSGVGAFNVSISNNFASGNGGGISIQKASNKHLDLQGITIFHNHANDSGGGIWMSNTNATLSNALIELCTANSGGGLAISNSNVTLYNVQLLNNTADSSGGGLLAATAFLSAQYVSILNNQAVTGGGVYLSASTLNGSSTTLAYNSAKLSGGGFSTKSRAFVNGLDIFSNYASGGGGACIEGKAVLTQLQISSCQAQGDGGGVLLLSTANVLCSNVSIYNNSAQWSGGGVAMMRFSQLHGDAFISKNIASEFGGGVYCLSGCMANGTALTQNAAGISGGGLALFNGNASLMNAVVSNNIAELGGGIASMYSTTEVINCTINGNQAGKIGGGVYILAGTIGFVSSEIKQSHAVVSGGGLTIVNGSVGGIAFNLTSNSAESYGGNVACLNGSLSNATIQNGSAHYGGGIYITNTSSSLRNLQITQNQAHSGGGIYLNNSFLYHESITLQDNFADSGASMTLSGTCKYYNSNTTAPNTIMVNFGAHSGGHIYAEPNAAVEMSSVSVKGGQNAQGGGLFIDVNSTFNATRMKFTENAATQGGAIVIFPNSRMALTNSTIISNTAASGGAIAASQAKIVLSQVSLQNNTAIVAGGALYLDNTQWNATFTNFTSNSAQTGGAVAIMATSITIFKHCGFYYNHGDIGGSVAIHENSNLLLVNTSMYGGQQSKNGGLIYVASSVTVLTQASYLFGGVATLGGALYLTDNATLIGTRTSFVNHSAEEGGAIYLNDYASAEFQASYFVSNVATYAGGAFFLDNGAAVKLISCSLSYNSAGCDGGGAYLTGVVGTRLSILSTNVSFNVAHDYGSGVYIGHGGTLIASASTFLNNGLFTSSRFGGGIYATSAIVNCTTTNFLNNSAIAGGALQIDRRSIIDAHSCYFQYNRASTFGGALNLAHASIGTLHSCMFINNQVGSGCGGAISFTGYSQLSINNMTAIGNKAYQGSGGGLYADNGAALALSSSLWINNSAADGGAIALTSFGPHTIEKCNFSYNKAISRGGAMYLDKDVLHLSTFALLVLSNNTAGSGGGLFWTSESAALVFNCSNCKAFNNSRYDIATNPINYTVTRWPDTFMSGVALSQFPPPAAYSLAALFNQSVARVWPEIQMSDVYGQTAVLDNFTTCTPDESTHFTWNSPQSIYTAVNGLVTLDNVQLVGPLTPSPVSIAISCSTVGLAPTTIELSIKMVPCQPGYYMDVKGWCQLCPANQYSMNGTACYNCPPGATCTQYIAQSNQASAQFGVALPRTLPNFYLDTAPSLSLQSLCNPEYWAVNDPCKKFVSSPFDIQDTLSKCLTNTNPSQYLEFWPPSREFTCLSRLSFYPCQIAGVCLGNIDRPLGDVSCAPGYRGSMCSLCAAGYATSLTGTCQVCMVDSFSSAWHQLTWQNFLFPLLGLIVLLIVFLGLRGYLIDSSEIELLRQAKLDQLLKAHTQRQASWWQYGINSIRIAWARAKKACIMPWKRKPKEKPRDVFGIEVESECNPDYLGLWLEKIKILTGFFQIFGNFRTTYLIAWPQPINDAMMATSQFSLDLVAIAGIDCFLPSTTYYTQFSTTLVVLAFFLALLLFFYYRGVSYYEAKLNLIPRCCSKCSLPVWDVYTREARVEPPRNRRQSIDDRQKRRRQSLERRSMTLLTAPPHATTSTNGVVAARRVLTALRTFMAEPDPHTTHARQLQREAIGMSTAKAYTKSLPMYRPTHRVCPAKPLPVHVRDRIMQSNLRVWQARVKLRLNYQTYRIKCHKVLFMVLLVLYPMISRNFLMMFNCDQVGQRYLLIKDRSLECYTYEWSIYAAISFGGVVVWVFGVPFLFWRSIYRARHRHIATRLKLLERREYRPLREKWLLEMRSMLAKEGKCVPSTLRFCDEMMYLGQYMKAKNLEDSTVMNRLGIMYQNYKSEFWWFEVLELIRKVLLNGMLVFLQTNAVKQSIAGLALCFFALFLTLHLKPYQSWTDSLIAGVTLFQLFLTLFLGLLLLLNSNCISSINPTNAIVNVPTISAIMVITNLAAVVVAVVTIFKDTYKNHRQVQRLRAARRQQLIRHAVRKLWRRAYNYAVFEAYRHKPSRPSVPFLLEHLRRMRLGTDDETVDLQDFANAFLRL